MALVLYGSQHRKDHEIRSSVFALAAWITRNSTRNRLPRKKTHIYSDSHARGKLPTKELVSENEFSTVSFERLNLQVFADRKLLSDEKRIARRVIKTYKKNIQDVGVMPGKNSYERSGRDGIGTR
jgi:hypothetical protein